MKLYKVYRHYCTPRIVIVLAKDEEQAKEMGNKGIGYTDVSVEEYSLEKAGAICRVEKEYITFSDRGKLKPLKIKK